VTDLYIERLGRPESDTTLVFMHGSGMDHAYFRPFVDSLCDEYQLVFYDHRQNGRSPRDPSINVDLDMLAQDAIDVIRTTITGRTILVAHSFAPWVALRATGYQGAPINGVVLVAPCLSLSTGRVLMGYLGSRSTKQQQELLEAAFTGRVTDDRKLEDVYREFLPHYFVNGSARQAAQMLDRVAVSALGFNQFLSTCFGALDWQQAVRALRIPCLVIAGSNDWLESDSETQARVVADLAALGSLRVLPDCGHFPFIEQPESFAEIVRTWLDSVPSM